MVFTQTKSILIVLFALMIAGCTQPVPDEPGIPIPTFPPATEIPTYIASVLPSFQETPTPTPAVPTDIALTSVTACELKTNPNDYLRKAVKVDGFLLFIGESIRSGIGNFYIEKDGCRAVIVSWESVIVQQCASFDEACDPLETMQDYLYNRVQLTGTFTVFNKEEQKAYGEPYGISEIMEVEVIGEGS